MVEDKEVLFLSVTDERNEARAGKIVQSHPKLGFGIVVMLIIVPTKVNLVTCGISGQQSVI